MSILRKGRKGIALFLSIILFTAFLTISFPAHAAVTEALLVGGTIAAFLSACGIIYTNTGVSGENALQALYDKFVTWNTQQQQLDDITSAFGQVLLYRGYLKIKESLSSVLSAFASDFVSSPVVLVSGDQYIAGGLGNYKLIPLSENSTSAVPYPLPYTMSFGTGYSYQGADGFTHTLVVSDRLNYYVDGTHYYLNGGASTQIGSTQGAFALGIYNNSIYCLYNVLGDRADQVKIGIGVLGILSSGGKRAVISTYSITHSQSIASVPAESLQAGEDTYLAPVVPGVTTLDGYINSVQTAIGDNTLDVAYVNGTNATIDQSIPTDVTGSVSIDGEVTIAPAELPVIDDITWGDIPELLTQVFPFSIPWDVKAGLECLRTDPEPPIWTITIPEVAGIDEQEVTIDLTDSVWDKCFAFVRWACIILWCAGLATASSRLIWGSD